MKGINSKHQSLIYLVIRNIDQDQKFKINKLQYRKSKNNLWCLDIWFLECSGYFKEFIRCQWKSATSYDCSLFWNPSTIQLKGQV